MLMAIAKVVQWFNTQFVYVVLVSHYSLWFNDGCCLEKPEFSQMFGPTWSTSDWLDFGGERLKVEETKLSQGLLWELV